MEWLLNLVFIHMSSRSSRVIDREGNVCPKNTVPHRNAMVPLQVESTRKSYHLLARSGRTLLSVQYSRAVVIPCVLYWVDYFDDQSISVGYRYEEDPLLHIRTTEVRRWEYVLRDYDCSGGGGESPQWLGGVRVSGRPALGSYNQSGAVSNASHRIATHRIASHRIALSLFTTTHGVRICTIFQLVET